MNRSGFIDEQHALRWLVRFALPFVNAKPDQLRKTAFDAYAQNIGKKHPCLCDGTDEVVEEFDFERYDIYKRVKDQELAALQKLIQAMLYIVLSGKKHEELPKDIKRQVTGIEREIGRVVNKTKYLPVWEGKGRSYAFPIEGKNEDSVVMRIEGYLVLAAVNCLYSISLSDDFEPIKSDGLEKLGMCPVCDTFFEKKRKDQEYCSDKCKKAFQMRRYREREKIK